MENQSRKKLLLVNLYPSNATALFLLSSYLLKVYLDKYLEKEFALETVILNVRETAKTPKICKKILKEEPDYIGYSCYVWNIDKIVDVKRELEDKGKFISILGGPEISIDRIKTFHNPQNAYYVIGEGERTLLNLLRFIMKGEGNAELELPKGVAAYIDNQISFLPNTESISDLDEIPSVYLEGVIDDQLYENLGAVLETQRGRRFRCKYCVYPKNLPTVSFYSLERIKSELEYLIVEKRIVGLRIFDAIFTQNLPRAKEIVQFLVDLKHRGKAVLPWIYWEFSADIVDREFLELVAKLKNKEIIQNANEIEPDDKPQLYGEMLEGYTAINCIGVQSFNREALKAVGRRKVDLNKFSEFMNAINLNNLVLKIDLILGLPYETFSSYFEGLDFFLPFFKDTDHILNIHRLQILPGSELADLCDTYKIRYSVETPHLVFSTLSMNEEEMNYASKLSTVLFRILNSPLRSAYFASQERSEKSHFHFTEEIYQRLSDSEELKKTTLFLDEFVDDMYWNGRIFSDIPSEFIAEIMAGY